MSNDSSTSEPANCCEAAYNSLTTYLQGQSAVLDQNFPSSGAGVNSLTIIQGEASSLLTQVQAALTSLLTNNCKCNCCTGPSNSIAAAYLSALQQAGFLTLGTTATPANGLTTALVGSTPTPTANVITVPAAVGSTFPTNGYVDIAGSLLSYSAVVPPPTPTQLAAFKTALLAYRSTLQANIEDHAIAPQVAAVTTLLAAFACPTSCKPACCLKARKEESSESCPPKPCCGKTHKHRESCYKKSHH